MTTVAYKDGVLAADTMMVRGDEPSYGAVKIFRTEKFLVGMSGGYANIIPFHHWLLEKELDIDTAGDLHKYWGDVPDYCSGLCALLIDRNGCIWNAVDAPPVCIPAKMDTIGSGGPYAMGAMSYGASAPDAVRVARKHDINTGGAVMRISFND
ncbi:proteasome subunit beta [Ruegeria phage vB_RpoS-V10]|nr:proteasome subunit beta [Roseobacter phage DSS3P8]AWY09230.1 proteasome subunit beta [Ruegeria phage vB_RpoS-V10]